MAIPRKIYIRNNYIFVEQNLVVNNYLAKDVFVKMQDGGYLMTVDTREPFTIGLLRIGEIVKQDGTLYAKDEWVEFYTKNTGSFISQSGSSTPGGNSSYDYTATNYTELITNYPIVFEGKKAFVYESQGTEWLPGSWGGNYYPAGHYIFNGVEWRFYS